MCERSQRQIGCEKSSVKFRLVVNSRARMSILLTDFPEQVDRWVVLDTSVLFLQREGVLNCTGFGRTHASALLNYLE